MPLRPEILHAPRPDGGVDLFDPLLDRLMSLSADDAAALDAPDPGLQARLAAALMLEGPPADAVRQAILAARRARPPTPPVVSSVPPVDWGRAEDLPDGVSPRWRDGESLRRLAEDRAAGRSVLILRQFLAPSFCEVLLREVASLPMQPMTTDIVRARRARVGSGLPALQEILLDDGARSLFGAVLGLPLAPRIELNAWRLEPGDHLRTHPDGCRYRATFALGLCADWRAQDGGAIAFGQPQPDGGLQVQERWLPHLGDLLLFRPSATSWHQVEPPTRTRWTVSGWWLEPDAGAGAP